MNFKLTKKKVITSIILSIILGLIIGFSIYNLSSRAYGDMGIPLNKSLPVIIIYFIITLIIGFVLIYLVYSIIENKAKGEQK